MTVQDIIENIEKLSAEDKNKITSYLLESSKESFAETRLSADDLAKLDQDEEDFHNGINISPSLTSNQDTLAYLHNKDRD